MPNENLQAAKNAKNDEFYTLYPDIQREINAYLEYDKDVFRGKTVLCPCDDPEWSNFTKFFAQNFEFLGLKKLISTSYAVDSKRNFEFAWNPTAFETSSPEYDKDKSRYCGKIFVLDRDTNQNGKIDIDDLQWHYMETDGDFRSPEVTALRDEADIIVTNPPFSLLREFMTWLRLGRKKFILITNKNSITYKDFFYLIKENKMWAGWTPMGVDLLFDVPPEVADELVRTGKEGSNYKIIDGKVYGRSTSMWFTNLEHGKRHRPLDLMTMDENIRYSRHKDIRDNGYLRYDNYDAIEVPHVTAIPSDYPGIMGVPISFLDKYCPEQFEIVGITKTWFKMASKIYPEQVQVDKNGKRSRVTKLNDGATIELSEPPENETYYIVDGKMYQQMYARVLIRHLNLGGE